MNKEDPQPTSEPYESDWLKQARIVDQLQNQYDYAVDGIKSHSRRVTELEAECEKLGPLIKQAREKLQRLQTTVSRT